MNVYSLLGTLVLFLAFVALLLVIIILGVLLWGVIVVVPHIVATIRKGCDENNGKTSDSVLPKELIGELVKEIQKEFDMMRNDMWLCKEKTEKGSETIPDPFMPGSGVGKEKTKEGSAAVSKKEEIDIKKIDIKKTDIKKTDIIETSRRETKSEGNNVMHTEPVTVSKTDDKADAGTENADGHNEREKEECVPADRESAKSILDFVRNGDKKNHKRVDKDKNNCLSEMTDGEMIIYRECEKGYILVPESVIVNERRYECSALGRCYELNQKIRSGIPYQIVGIDRKCIVEKEGDIYHIVEKGKLRIEES